jgi:hypothetical protein
MAVASLSPPLSLDRPVAVVGARTAGGAPGFQDLLSLAETDGDLTDDEVAGSDAGDRVDASNATPQLGAAALALLSLAPSQHAPVEAAADLTVGDGDGAAGGASPPTAVGADPGLTSAAAIGGVGEAGDAQPAAKAATAASPAPLPSAAPGAAGITLPAGVTGLVGAVSRQPVMVSVAVADRVGPASSAAGAPGAKRGGDDVAPAPDAATSAAGDARIAAPGPLSPAAPQPAALSAAGDAQAAIATSGAAHAAARAVAPGELEGAKVDATDAAGGAGDPMSPAGIDASADVSAPTRGEPAAASAGRTVSAPSSPVQTHVAAAAVAAVAAAVTAGAVSRRTRFEVRLDPGELGRVDVRLDIAHDGRLATRLIVDRPETLDLLKQDARELTRTLENAGFQLGQGGLSLQLRDGGGRGAWPLPDATPGSPPAQVESETQTPVYVRPSPVRAGGVDVTA